jgi:sugar lactone lactonase YvrE
MSAAQVVAATSDLLGESPLWCPEQGTLFWVDIRAPALRRLEPASGQIRSFVLPELCGAVSFSSPGRVVLSLSSGLYLFDLSTEALSPLVAPEPAERGNRLNDTKADRRGRLWVGTMRDYGAATTGALYRVGPDLVCTATIAPVTVPNAISWSPDDRVMYFADTGDGRIRAYDFDVERGTLGRMRILVEAGLIPGKPDGATVDAEGCVWNARFGGGAVVRITPEGALDRTIPIPVSFVTSCAFGGTDLTTLYVTTARQKLTPAELNAQPYAGAVFAVDAGVRGLPEPRFIPAVHAMP